MKGYITKQGKVMFADNGNGRAIGTITLANGKSAEIDMPIDKARIVHLEDVPGLLSAFANGIPFVAQ